MDKDDIFIFLKTHQDELEDKSSLVKRGLFGAYTKESAVKESDINLYTEFENKKFSHIAVVWNYLAKAFSQIVKFSEIVFHHYIDYSANTIFGICDDVLKEFKSTLFISRKNCNQLL